MVERFFRTLKEQAIYGRIFRTAAEVSTAVTNFVTHYNASWRLARLGYLSPLDYRKRHDTEANLQMTASAILRFDRNTDRSRRPDLGPQGRRAQHRSSKAEGLRGLCLTGASTLAISARSGLSRAIP